METYGYKIKELLKEEHIKRKDLAAKMDISETALGKIQSGKTKLKLDHIEAIAEITGRSLADVVGYLSNNSDSDLLADSGSLESRLKARLDEKEKEIAELKKELEITKEKLKLQTELAESRLEIIKAKEQILNYRLTKEP